MEDWPSHKAKCKGIAKVNEARKAEGEAGNAAALKLAETAPEVVFKGAPKTATLKAKEAVAKASAAAKTALPKASASASARARASASASASSAALLPPLASRSPAEIADAALGKLRAHFDVVKLDPDSKLPANWQSDLGLVPDSADAKMMVSEAAAAIWKTPLFWSPRNYYNVGHGCCEMIVALSDKTGALAHALGRIAVPSLEKALDFGGAEMLASLYEKGIGCARDAARAHELYLEAAESGSREAAHKVAVNYETGGGGVAVNLEHALLWHAHVITLRFDVHPIDSHIESKNTIASVKAIGGAYEHGRGVKKDIIKALKAYILLIPLIPFASVMARKCVQLIRLSTVDKDLLNAGGWYKWADDYDKLEAEAAAAKEKEKQRKEKEGVGPAGPSFEEAEEVGSGYDSAAEELAALPEEALEDFIKPAVRPKIAVVGEGGVD